MDDIFIDAFNLTGKVALITGGASGLGFAMAKCLSSAGAKVIICGRSEPSTLEKSASQIGNNASYYQFDITKLNEIDGFIKGVIEDHGKIDILINNAGMHCKKPVEEMTIEDFNNILNVHLLGSFAMTKAVLPDMRRNKEGSIIFVSSMSALFGLTNVTAYSSAKSAILGLTKSLASEVSPDNVRVNAIIPGFIESPMFRKVIDGDINRQNKILGRTPMGKYGDAMDIGWAALYLSSKASGFVTGTSLVVDGGCSIGF